MNMSNTTQSTLNNGKSLGNSRGDLSPVFKEGVLTYRNFLSLSGTPRRRKMIVKHYLSKTPRNRV